VKIRAVPASRLFAAILLGGTAFAPLLAQETSPPPATGTPPTPAEPAAAAPAPETPAPETAAPDEAAPDDVLPDDPAEPEIVVTGQRVRGAVLSDIPPENQLDRREIRGLGVSNVAELLSAIAPQTRSGRGRGDEAPILLVNGRRISSFSEIRDLPPEAIERVDILPEEVALRYGYGANQRVVNMVLRRRFRAVTTEVTAGFPTAGGRSNYGGDLNFLRLQEGGRFSIDVNFQHAGSLLESERDLIPSASSRPFALAGNVGPAPFAAGVEIDPALSALLGRTVTVAGVPAGTGRQPLSAFGGPANSTDLGRYRTLLPETDQLSVNTSVNRTVFGNVSATLNLRFDLNSSNSLFGLSSASILVPRGNPFSPFGTDVTVLRYLDPANPLERQSDSRSGHVGLSLNGDLLPWRWSVTGNYDRGSSLSRTATGVDISTFQSRIIANDPVLNPFADIPDALLVASPYDRAHTQTQSANLDGLLTGPLLTLPGGPVQASVRVGLDSRDLSSRTLRSGVVQERDLSRDRENVQASIDIPIASRRRAFLEQIGNLSVNLNAEADHLSDFGTLTTLGAGINWSPIAPISLIASFTREEGAPSMQQLGDPVQVTPNVRVFDFTRRETVEITRVDGGNPNLLADNRRVFKLGATIRPFTEKDLSLSANFNSSRILNPIASFPTATPELEAAFPDRFTRDQQGRLLRIDARSVNFARSDRSELRWGLNFSTPIGPQPPAGGGFRGGFGGRPGAAGTRPAAPAGQTPPATGAAPAGGQTAQGAPGGARGPGGGAGGRGPGGGGRGGFGGGGFGGGGGGGGGRLQLAFYHTWHFRDEILIRPGVPVLDLLHGSATGSRGGQPQHELEFQGGIFRNGLGARLTANWQSGTTVRGGQAGSGATASDLSFSDFSTVNLRLFADLGLQQGLVRKYPWTRGMRVSLSVDNLFDARLRVRDQAGATPLSYQPDYLDPLGRSVRLSIRKLFF
jgi:iron complex outermembrane receptor protein